MELLRIFHLDFLHRGAFVTSVTLKGSEGEIKKPSPGDPKFVNESPRKSLPPASCQKSCILVGQVSTGPLFCPLSLHGNVALTHAPVWHGLGLVTASRELLPPPSTAVPSSAQPVLPPPLTLLHSGFSWEKVLLHSSICVGQTGPPPCNSQLGTLGQLSLPSLVMSGRNGKAVEGSSPWQSHSGWLM